MNPLFEKIRLMVVSSTLASHGTVNNLKESEFCLGDDNRVARLWAQKQAYLHKFHKLKIPHIPSSPKEHYTYGDTARKYL